MGPMRRRDEATSVFRLRYAKYCAAWLIALALPMVLLISVSPNTAAFSPGYLSYTVMFLYIGLPIGIGMALLASVGYLIGGGWSYFLERDAKLAKIWPKAKKWLKASVFLSLVVFASYMVVRGFLDAEVFIPSRGKGLPKISWSEDPLGYLACMVIWGAFAIGFAIYQYREFRRVHAA